MEQALVRPPGPRQLRRSSQGTDSVLTSRERNRGRRGATNSTYLTGHMALRSRNGVPGKAVITNDIVHTTMK